MPKVLKPDAHFCNTEVSANQSMDCGCQFGFNPGDGAGCLDFTWCSLHRTAATVLGLLGEVTNVAEEWLESASNEHYKCDIENDDECRDAADLNGDNDHKHLRGDFDLIRRVKVELETATALLKGEKPKKPYAPNPFGKDPWA